MKVKFYKGVLTILACSSQNTLYSEELVSFDSQTIDQKDAEGFVKYHEFQARMYQKLWIGNKVNFLPAFLFLKGRMTFFRLFLAALDFSLFLFPRVPK